MDRSLLSGDKYGLIVLVGDHMDITSYINSKDIRDYHREIGIEYNALEAAWLVYHNRGRSLEEKHAAWQWIIDNMPDMPIDCVRLYEEYQGSSVHEAIKAFMDMQNRFIEEFTAPKDGWVYRYKYYISLPDVEESCLDQEGVFSSWDKCIEFIGLYEDVRYMTGISIYRTEVDSRDYFPSRHGHIYVDVQRKIMDIEPWFDDETEKKKYHGLIRFFDDMWFEFPVPFKKGDIVTLAAEDAKSSPIVLESTLVPPGENAEEYRKWRKENGGDTSDMCFWGYAIDVVDYSGYNGIYTDNFWNYMDIKYYRGELKGRQRVLKSISAWLKGELGDDPELMLIAYHRIMLEEALSQTVPCLYTNEGLQKVGLQERE